MNFIKKYWKAIIFCLVLIGLLFVGVLAFHWEETAKTKFWWTAWPVIGVLCVIAFIGLVYWFGSTKNKW